MRIVVAIVDAKSIYANVDISKRNTRAKDRAADVGGPTVLVGANNPKREETAEKILDDYPVA